MNKQQIKGVANEATGEVKEHIGRALNDREMEAKGHARELKGKIQKKLGDAQESLKESLKQSHDASIRRDEAIVREQDLRNDKK